MALPKARRLESKGESLVISEFLTRPHFRVPSPFPQSSLSVYGLISKDPFRAAILWLTILKTVQIHIPLSPPFRLHRSSTAQDKFMSGAIKR